MKSCGKGWYNCVGATHCLRIEDSTNKAEVMAVILDSIHRLRKNKQCFGGRISFRLQVENRKVLKVALSVRANKVGYFIFPLRMKTEVDSASSSQRYGCCSLR
jgi:hypothetical protein